ncbi:hypothetical protein SLEP1_g8701 [Rubroshorea leprosula]|uniref:Uncharacterized protein n=1 Tax=Rubroshorea leprosula TaxID=152421 RepID=A0AAV5I8G9_9ROSI|nr:hypothetical protein SLEP1_g8701 [Rubroshorea leprosula]
MRVGLLKYPTDSLCHLSHSFSVFLPTFESIIATERSGTLFISVCFSLHGCGSLCSVHRWLSFSIAGETQFRRLAGELCGIDYWVFGSA